MNGFPAVSSSVGRGKEVLCHFIQITFANKTARRNAVMDRPEVPQFEEQEIDLLEVFHVLWSKAWLLALSLIFGVAAMGAVTFFLITPQYKASSVIYILSRTTSITSLADLQIGSQLAADFQIIATTREVVEVVMEQYGIADSYENFVKTIEVTNPSGSHMLQITVTNPDPQLAAQLSNALSDQLKLQIAEVMSTDTPSTVQRAVVPTRPSSPSLLRNCAIGGLGMLFLVAGILLVTHFLDDTIKDEDDVRRYLNLNTLAAIPLQRGMLPGNSRDGGKNKRGRSRAVRS